MKIQQCGLLKTICSCFPGWSGDRVIDIFSQHTPSELLAGCKLIKETVFIVLKEARGLISVMFNVDPMSESVCHFSEEPLEALPFDHSQTIVFALSNYYFLNYANSTLSLSSYLHLCPVVSHSYLLSVLAPCPSPLAVPRWVIGC